MIKCILLDINVSNIGNNILNWIQEKASFLIDFLPTSPFRKAINLIGEIPYMSEIAWFVPIQEIVLILMWWGSAIAIYYGYMIILRWVKAIE